MKVNAVMKMPTLEDVRKSFKRSGVYDLFVDMTVEAKRWLEARMRDYITGAIHNFHNSESYGGGHLLRAVSIKPDADLDWRLYSNPSKAQTMQFYNLSYMQPANSGGSWQKFRNPWTGTPQSQNTTLAIEIGWHGYQWRGHSVGGYGGSHPIMNSLKSAEAANIYANIFARKLKAAGFDVRKVMK